ncbi:MAG: hypothetical protein H6937_11630, partial [Burkholderiales bacterium]|nr:hypothetical protein [Burkholderiales bacterium]
MSNLLNSGGGGREYPYLSMFLLADAHALGWELSNDLYGYLIQPNRVFFAQTQAPISTAISPAVEVNVS